MIRAGAVEKGMCLLIKNEPYLVTEREFVNPGKGSAFVRLKLKGSGPDRRSGKP
jgi:elongation factor P